jgi:hypothetical protein
VPRCNPSRSIAGRRNLFVLLCVALPYLFFTLAGTKFAHYIFPVVPMAAVIVAALLVWLGPDGEPVMPLAEEGPQVGPNVPPYAEGEESSGARQGVSRGEMLLIAALALVTFGILSHDLALDFRYFLRLFIYYYNRATPFSYQPIFVLQVIFLPMGIFIGLWLLARHLHLWHVVGLALSAVVLACYLGWVTMPAMAATYSYKPVFEAYARTAKSGELVGQYNDWQQPERSVIFLFQNRAQHLRNESLTKAFLARPGRKFIIVDHDRLADLRRLAKEQQVKLFVLFDDHPYARLVSTEPNPEDARQAREHILSSLPAEATPADADFGGKIRLIGWRAPEVVRRGTSAEVSFYYRAVQLIDADWQIFVHGDSPQGGGRIRGDHYPVGSLYPTDEWQEGEIIEDRFRLDVPADYANDSFTLWTGFYRGEKRLPVVVGPSAPSDGDNRVRGPTLRVGRDP